MGQKVNPHGLRVGVIKDWDSRWYARNEKVGDLLVGDGVCDILALEEITGFLLLHLEQAGRAKLKAAPLPLDRLEPPEVKVKVIRDTVSSLRLDAVAASGFSLSRGRAS